MKKLSVVVDEAIAAFNERERTYRAFFSNWCVGTEPKCPSGTFWHHIVNINLVNTGLMQKE